MATMWTVPGVNNFVIGTDRDKMGISDWEVFLVDLSNNTITDETANVTIEELIQPIDDPASGTIAKDLPEKTKIIPLEDGDGANFAAGMKVKITTSLGDEYREVRQVTGDILVLFKPLNGSVKADSDDDGTNDAKVTQVGNTGDYNVTVNSDDLSSPLEPGKNYQFQVKSDSAEIDVHSAMFHAISYDMDDLKEDVTYLKKGMDDLLNGGLGTARIYI